MFALTSNLFHCSKMWTFPSYCVGAFKCLCVHCFLQKQKCINRRRTAGAIAGEWGHDYTALEEELAEKDLAQKMRRLRVLPALKKAARREERRFASYEEEMYFFDRCKELGIGKFSLPGCFLPQECSRLRL